jgi:NAD(P)H-hydrate epimerase
VPWEEVEDYIEKSDAVLIGPGFMRARSEAANHSEACDEECEKTMNITKRLLNKFPDKKWVIDAGSLQVMEPSWIPKEAIVTPNKKEYKMLFGSVVPQEAARKHECIIVLKGPVTYVYSPDKSLEIHGGNPGMTKGGTGDVMAGLTVGLLAKNPPLLAASAAAYITKAAGDSLYKIQGVYYNADDLAEEIPKTLFRLL